MPDAPRSSSFSVDPDKASIWIDDVLETDVEFPPLPRTVAEVSHLVAKEEGEPDTQRLASLVNNDPVIAATVLQRINSAYFGMRRRITNVRKAVMLLGFLDVANVVLTAGFLQLEEIFSDADQVSVFRHIMRDSIGAGQFARELADGLGLSNGGPAYSAGLLHNLGRLVLLYNAPDDYTALQHADDNTRLPSPEAEAQIFGVDHAELGASALNAWSLPPVLIEAVRHYATPATPNDATHQRAAALVGTAAVALNTPDAPDALRRASQTTFLAEHIELPTSRIIELVEARRQRVHDFVSMMMVA
jgi:HD-like signal output (HDOD) protein